MYTLHFDGIFMELAGSASERSPAGIMSYGWLIFRGERAAAQALPDCTAVRGGRTASWARDFGNDYAGSYAYFSAGYANQKEDCLYTIQLPFMGRTITRTSPRYAEASMSGRINAKFLKKTRTS